MWAALHAIASAAYTPDDGTQGYTPYFYKMDVPVRVRNTISYGRAWQMLRSRGAGSNVTGPCDPPQSAASCNCSSARIPLPPNPGLVDTDDVTAMPRCMSSPLCSTDLTSTEPLPDRAAILIVLDIQQQNMRFPIGNCAACMRRGYGRYVREILRILLSLKAVGTRLPIHILASGERYPQVEARLSSLFGVSFIQGPAPPVVVPEWASKWARGSFAKLRALSLTQYARLVVLDADDIVLKNIDHLAAAPAPAFVFGWKCYPRRELRASTMVLAPNAADWERASQLLGSASTAVYDDLGEQSVWRRLYASAYELPVRYATMRTADLPASEWPKVHIVHDAHLIHDVSRAGWHGASMTPIVTRADQEATQLFKAQFAADFADPPKSKPDHGKRRGKKRNGRLLRGSGGRGARQKIAKRGWNNKS